MYKKNTYICGYWPSLLLLFRDRYIIKTNKQVINSKRTSPTAKETDIKI